MTAQELAKQAAEFILNEAIDADTGIVISKCFGPLKNHWQKRESTIDDFGDYLHYVRWYGDVFSDRRAKDFPLEQLDLWEQFKFENGLFASPINPQKGITKKNRLRVSLYDHQDALLGLIELYKQTKQEEFLQTAIGIADNICKIAVKHKGLIPHEILGNTQRASPWTLCFSEVAGLYMENLCNLFAIMGDYKYYEIAQLVARRWTSDKTFQQTGLWVQAKHHWFPWLSYNLKWHKTKPMKDNTNMVFGLLSVYKMTNNREYANAAKHVLSGLQKLSVSKNAGYAFWYDFKTGTISDPSEVLTQNHPVIDAFIESYKVLKDDSCLTEAERLTNIWLSRKNALGLLPEHWCHGRSVPSITRVDAFCDFHTNCLKLAELTGKKEYLTAANDAVKTLAEYFAPNDRYWWTEGVAAEGTRWPTPNETKFVGGVLRYCLLHDYVSDGGKIYGEDSSVWSLIRDR